MAAFVYLLRCRDGSLYCGWTDDLERRVATHNAGKGARYTRARAPVRLVWSEAVADRSAALRRELAVKRLSRLQKLALAGLPLRVARRRDAPLAKPAGSRASRP